MNLLTPKMIFSTVMCDERTCLWFRRLLLQPMVVERLKGSPVAGSGMGQYRLHTGLTAAVLVLAAGLFLTGIFFFHGHVIIWAAIAAVAVIGSVPLMIRARRGLAALAVDLYTLDQEAIPAGATLYQLGEFYARKYGGPSLVQVIWVWDQVLRDALLLLFVMTLGVYFLPAWLSFFLIAGGCGVVACVVKVVLLKGGSKRSP
ncbi:MAG: hypothetical protein WCO69_03345 [Candidatus Omnitrophota bacterium]